MLNNCIFCLYFYRLQELRRVPHNEFMPGTYNCINQFCGGVAAIHDKYGIFDIFYVKFRNHFLRCNPFAGIAGSKSSIYNDPVQKIVDARNKCLNLRLSLACLCSVQFGQLVCAGKIQTRTINSKQLISVPAG